MKTGVLLNFQLSLKRTLLLLSAERMKKYSVDRKVRVFPFIFACVNLLASGYFDQYIRFDAVGHYLTLYFFIQGAVSIVLAFAFYKQNLSEILLKTNIFPFTFWNRFVFVLIGIIKQSLFLSWVVTTVMSLIVFYHTQPSMSIYVVCFYALLIVILEIIFTVLILITLNPLRDINGFIFFLLFTFFTIGISAVIFNFDSPVLHTPLISWAISGIFAARRYDSPAVLLNVLFFISTAVIALLAGRKYS